MTRRELFVLPFLPQPPAPDAAMNETEDLVRKIDSRIERLAEQLGVAHSQVLEQLRDRQQELQESTAALTALIEKTC
jgi:hypothetical protein